MRMRFKFFLLIGLLIVLSATIDSKKIHVLNFSEFEPHLSRFNDTTYVINFWATWCIPCRKELPDLEKINSVYKEKRVKVVLVSLDIPDKLDKTLIPFIEKLNIRSEVMVLDDPNSNYWINQVDPSWSGAIPATIIYNKKYREFFPNPITYDKLDSIINLNMIKP